jgi:hypothetical protein
MRVREKLFYRTYDVLDLLLDVPVLELKHGLFRSKYQHARFGDHDVLKTLPSKPKLSLDGFIT